MKSEKETQNKKELNSSKGEQKDYQNEKWKKERGKTKEKEKERGEVGSQDSPIIFDLSFSYHTYSRIQGMEGIKGN